MFDIDEKSPSSSHRSLESLDLSLIPLKKNSKHPPIIQEWESVKYPKELMDKHNGNRGLACGEMSEGVIAFDLDFREGYNRKKDGIEIVYNEFKEEYPKFMNTGIVETPHGYHFYYVLEDNENINNTSRKSGRYDAKRFYGINKIRFSKWLKGVETRANGGYTVFPPSEVDGVRYKWINKTSLLKITREEYQEIFDFFNVPKEEVAQNTIRKGFVDILNGKIDIGDLVQETGEDEHVYWKEVFHEVLSVCGCTPEELLEGLEKFQKSFNLDKTEEQLKNEKVREYIFNGKRLTSEKYEKYFPMCINKDNIFSKKKYSEIELRELYEQTRNAPWCYPRGGKEWETNSYKKWKTKKLREWGQSVDFDEIDENLKRQIEMIADQLLKEFDVVTLEDTREVLVRNRNAYLFDNIEFDEAVRDKIKLLDRGMYDTVKKNLLSLIRDSSLFKREYFYADPLVHNYQNGTYDFRKNIFLELDEVKERKYFYEISIDYKNDKRYTCPIFKNVLRSWLYPKNSLTKYLIWDVFEMIGLSMSLNTSFKKAFIPYGPKDCGKTQFTNILGALFDRNNRSSTSLQRIGKNEFGTDNFQFKVINICDDLPGKKIISMGVFKDLTGGGILIQGELKGGKKFQFKCYLKFWFNANIIPEVENYKDVAGIERLMLIPFRNVFTPYKTDGFKREFYKDIINNEDEMQGIIHEAIRGYKRLLKRGGFREVIIKDSMHNWIYESDKIYHFVYDNCIKTSKGRVEWNSFKEKFNADMFESYSPQKLKSYIERLGLAKKKGSLDNEKIWFIYGIKWKEGCEPLEEDDDESETKIDDKNNLSWFMDKQFGVSK